MSNMIDQGNISNEGLEDLIRIHEIEYGMTTKDQLWGAYYKLIDEGMLLRGNDISITNHVDWYPLLIEKDKMMKMSDKKPGRFGPRELEKIKTFNKLFR
jgi:hypothetical protein